MGLLLIRRGHSSLKLVFRVVVFDVGVDTMAGIPLEHSFRCQINGVFDLLKSKIDKNPGGKCKHFKLGSSEECVKRSMNLLTTLLHEQKLTEKIPIQQVEIIAETAFLCEQCTFMFLVKCYHYINTILGSKCDLATVACALQFWYLIQTEHPMYSSFIFNTTNIWYWSIRNLLWLMYFKRNGSCFPQLQRHKMRIKSLCAIMSEVTFRLYLYKRRHWKIITFKLDVIGEIFKFIKYEMQHRLLLLCENKDSFSDSLFQMFQIFLVKWLVYYDNYKNRKNISNRKRYCKRLRRMNRKVDKFRHQLQSFHKPNCLPFLNKKPATKMHIMSLLRCFSDYKDYDQIINRNCKEIRKLRREYQKCQRVKCSQIRGNDTFYICKRCRVATYCSRRCFKKDWNPIDSVHRNYCQKYVDIINNKTSVNKWKTGDPLFRILRLKYQLIISA